MTHQQRLDSLEPAFKAQIIILLDRIEDITERRWIITAGRRTLAEQQELYAQGRTKPGKVVTKAKPGYSAHNYGLAVDLAPLKLGSEKIYWNASQSIWKAMADAAQDIGLTAGYYFKSFFDMPHVESSAWEDQRKLWLAGKLELL